MKHHMTGKVVGVELVQPDPKDLPEFEAAKVKVQFTTSLTVPNTKFPLTVRSTGTLIVPIDEVGHRGDFALGRVITADFEDYQQDLGLSRARLTIMETEGEYFDTATGVKVEEDSDVEVELQIPGEKPVRGTAKTIRRLAERIKGSKSRTTSRHN